jgi:hypothetical protein
MNALFNRPVLPVRFCPGMWWKWVEQRGFFVNMGPAFHGIRLPCFGPVNITRFFT